MPRSPRQRPSSSSPAPRVTPVRLAGLHDGTIEDLRSADYHDAARFADLDTSGIDLADVQFSGCGFERIRTDALALRGARLMDCVITALEAPVIDAPSTFWRDIEIRSSRSGSADLYDAELRAVRITESKLGYLNVRGARVTDLLIEGCSIEELDLGGATATRLRLVDCRIGTLDVTRATLTEVDLRGGEFSVVRGLDSLRGAIIGEHQLAEFGPLFAAALGVRIE
ncbi:pentapeptide repeat-containing protein [Labedella populi]|uniref:Pentapeptide repeat-containing protein n=1 Tax=Labedella populi TaxID=2498850 RepID=A0A3S5CM13_9MICO|nr:pentapeptide repeat-containing protein [Labedella populi]RWZ64444.1 pentapeptide repeat-containing protein [Labedella populi]